MSEEMVIREATFNPKVCNYWLLTGVLVCICTIVGIPFLLIWLPLGHYLTRRYLDRMECVLTAKALKVKKGILVRVEKTIPLEKITDMGMVQGPIMRNYGLHTLSVETAGQSGPGALVALTGIEGAVEFREAVLAQRDAIAEGASVSALAESTGGDAESLVLLREIRDSLVRLEAVLGKDGKGE